MKSVQIVKEVSITGGLWKQWHQLIADKAIPYQLRVLKDEGTSVRSGALQNFRIAAGEAKGEYFGTCFQDSDVGKWLEAVAYLLERKPNPQLEHEADEVIDCVARAQQPDGYLNTYFTVAEPGKRFTNLRECCELYSFGHLAEAAAAYYEATGKRKLLDVMCRYADLLHHLFGPGKNQCHGYDGHPEAEYALLRLYQVTGTKAYLDLALYFLEVRGSEPYYYTQEFEARGGKHFYQFNTVPPAEDRAYDIANVPPRQQTEAIGHAVKLCYLLQAMASAASITGDKQLLTSSQLIFDSLSTKRMYVTGGVGSSRHQERFTFDYDLPNDRAYAETCAAAGVVFAARSLCAAQPNARYADVMELALFNGLLAGMSLSGDRWFYANPLEVWPEANRLDPDMCAAKPIRQEWFCCACCPPNLARTVASIHRYLYLSTGNDLYVNLYANSRANIPLAGGYVQVTQQTDYPWEGTIRFTVEASGQDGCTLCLRRPGWAKEHRVKLGDKYIEAPLCSDGYLRICCPMGNTQLVLELPMEPICLQAHPRVKADAGKIAVRMGPIVFCMEQADNGTDLHSLSIAPQAGFHKRYGVLPLAHAPMLVAKSGWRDATEEFIGLYRPYHPLAKPAQVAFVPYFLWGNRRKKENEAEEMMLWVRAHS